MSLTFGSTTDGTSTSANTATRTRTYTQMPPLPTVTMPPYSTSHTPSRNGITVPASLYFITLAIALVLIVIITVAMVLRRSVLQTRIRRTAAIRAMATASSRRDRASQKKPALWDISMPTANETNTVSVNWSGIQPLALGAVMNPTILSTKLVPAPPPTRMERLLQLPVLPPGAEAYMPVAKPVGHRFRARLRGCMHDPEAGISTVPASNQHTRVVSVPVSHNGGLVCEERAGETGVGSALEKPVRVGLLLAMPAGEVVLGTLDRRPPL